MTPLDIAEIISLSITPVTIYFSCLVAGLWWGAFLDVAKSSSKHRTPHQWFIIGVVISFIGQAGDNLYWGIAWACETLGLKSAPMWFKHGVISNIPMRQVAGAMAAYCHLRAWAGANKTDLRWLDSTVKWSIVTGIWVAAFIIFARKLWVFS